MYYKCITLVFLVALVSSCTIATVDKESDITIVSANMLSSNSESKFDITSSLLKLDADVYLLHDAEVGNNIDQALFINNNYTLFSHTESQASSYYGVIASRITAEYESLDFSYSYTDLISKKLTTIAPFYGLRIIVNSIPISIIGAHIPHSIKMSLDINELRENAFKDISSIIDNGTISTTTGIFLEGDNVIIGGDFNTFPTDSLLDYILNSGMDDSFLSNLDRYDFSWNPKSIGLNVARIDYIFYTKHFTAVYQDCVAILGSDHQGIITGINLQ